MNILSIDYIENNIDDIDKIFNVINEQYEFNIMKINNDYYLEKSLSNINNSFLFENVKTETDNGFKKYIKGFFQAIINFIDNIINSIKVLFISKKNIDIDDYLKSHDGKLQLDKDVNKLKKSIDEDISNGNKLLQRITSKLGVTHKEVDEFINNSKKKIALIGPIVVGGVASHFSYKKFMNDLNDNKQSLQKSRNILNNGLDSDSESMVRKILNHLSSLTHLYGDEIMKIIKIIQK